MPLLNSDDVLAHSITALKAFKEASSAISAVPVLSAVVGAVLELIETIETVRHNKEQCYQLKQRVIELGNELKEDFDEYRDGIDPSLNVQLARMLSVLDGIKTDLKKLSRQGCVSRWVHQGSIQTALEKHLGTVNQLSHKYIRNMLKILVKANSQQAIYTKDHHRYFRDCDLELGPTRSLLTNRDVYSLQRIARYNGRVVAVRYLRPGRDIEDVIDKTIGKLLQCHNHNVARYLGRSHPAMSRDFIVLESGHLKVAHYLWTHGDAAEKLCCFLQMQIDWKSLLGYLMVKGVLDPTRKEMHRHSSECLTSLSLSRNGTFIVSADDLSSVCASCLDYRLGVEHSELPYIYIYGPLIKLQVDSTDWDNSYDAGSRSMMRILAALPCSSDLDVVDLHKARLPRIWFDRLAMQDTKGEIGDYGYEDHQLGRFVRLGNVFNILRHEHRVVWQDWTLLDGIAQTTHDCDVSKEVVWRLVPESNRNIGQSLDCGLYAEDMERFWWLYAHEVAKGHNMPLEELVVVRTISYICEVTMNASMCGPDEVYFHRLPVTATGEPSSPSGYWSLEEQAVPGPWPDITITGVELQQWNQVEYTYLSTLQAQLVTCFCNALRMEATPRSSSESRIPEYSTTSESPRSREANQQDIRGGREYQDEVLYCLNTGGSTDDEVECYGTLN